MTPMKMESHVRAGAGWRGRFFLAPGWMLYCGPIGATAPHAHHAIQVVLVSGGEQTIDPLVIPPDTRHAIAAPIEHGVVLYLSPETRSGRRLSTLLGDAPASWTAAGALLQAAAPEAPRTLDEARRFRDHVLALLIGSHEAVRPWPPAVQQLVTIAPTRLAGRVTLPALAEDVGLSASRLSHLVTEHLGIPFREYLRWLRMVRAVATIARGRTITEAAFDAGFSDGPHLSRTFREMFGVTPSTVAIHATWDLDVTFSSA